MTMKTAGKILVVLEVVFWIAVYILVMSFFTGCDMNATAEVKITQETEKLVYECQEESCGHMWVKSADLVDVPNLDFNNLTGTGDVCTVCGSVNITIVGEIGPDGQMIEYEY